MLAGKISKLIAVHHCRELSSLDIKAPEKLIKSSWRPCLITSPASLSSKISIDCKTCPISRSQDAVPAYDLLDPRGGDCFGGQPDFASSLRPVA